MRAHEAGALHGDIGNRGPAWLRVPQDVNALVPQLWPRTVTRADAGALEIGGVSVLDLAPDTPVGRSPDTRRVGADARTARR